MAILKINTTGSGKSGPFNSAGVSMGSSGSNTPTVRMGSSQQLGVPTNPMAPNDFGPRLVVPETPAARQEGFPPLQPGETVFQEFTQHGVGVRVTSTRHVDTSTVEQIVDPQKSLPETAGAEGEVVDAEMSPLPEGTYWSEKFERYVSPGDSVYSVETAKRLGVV